MDNSHEPRVIDLKEAGQRLAGRMRGPLQALRKSGFILLFVMLAALVLVRVVYVHPNEYGIKINRLGMARGVQATPYDAGLHFLLPFGIQSMEKLPRDLQVLELTNYPGATAARNVRFDRAAHIQTSDGFFVDVDVSIVYRLIDPYKVFTTIGPGMLYETNGIIPKTEPALKQTLGELTTEEFYNSPLRVRKAEKARELLNAELKSKGIEVEQVLVRYFKYNDEIQKNIEEKKLKDQLVFKNQAEARAAIEQATLTKIIEEGKVAVSVELEGGKAYITRRNAERDQYVRTKRAEADLQIKLAEAARIRLKNDALQGQGSERMVGLKMADVYRGLDVIVLPSDGKSGVNPLDLNKTLDLFSVTPGGSK